MSGLLETPNLESTVCIEPARICNKMKILKNETI